MPRYCIETSRLILRPFNQEDLESFLVYWNDPRYLTFYPWTSPVQQQGVQLFEDILSWQCQSPVTKYQFVVIEKLSGRIIGNCGSRLINNSEADIGYELNPDWWGQRIGQELASIMTDFGFQALHSDRIIAEVIGENIRSINILNQLGFVLRTVKKNHEFFKGRFWDLNVYEISDPRTLKTVCQYSLSSIP